MPHLTTDDNVRLYYEGSGSGIPIVFVHEFAGDYRAWESQVRYFARCYRCITYNARGYPPSDVPADGARYSQERARDDIRAVLDALKIEKAHVVGLSMGGFAALHFGFSYPQRARSLVVAGCGYGAAPKERQHFAEGAEAEEGKCAEERRRGAPFRLQLSAARAFAGRGGLRLWGRAQGASAIRGGGGGGGKKVRAGQHGEGGRSLCARTNARAVPNKDPRGWKEFVDQLT